MTSLSPPSDLSRSAKKAFRNLVKTIRDRGIDPLLRSDLIEDFIRQAVRLAELRTQEQSADETRKLQMVRALNTANVERRRLHAEIFKGAVIKPPPVLTSQQAKIAVAASTADEAWRAHFRNGKGLREMGDPEMQRRVAAWEAEDKELEARVGPASWAALVYSSIEAQIAGERAIARSWRQGHKKPPADDEEAAQ